MQLIGHEILSLGGSNPPDDPRTSTTVDWRGRVPYTQGLFSLKSGCLGLRVVCDPWKERLTNVCFPSRMKLVPDKVKINQPSKVGTCVFSTWIVVTASSKSARNQPETRICSRTLVGWDERTHQRPLDAVACCALSLSADVCSSADVSSHDFHRIHSKACALALPVDDLDDLVADAFAHSPSDRTPVSGWWLRRRICRQGGRRQQQQQQQQQQHRQHLRMHRIRQHRQRRPHR